VANAVQANLLAATTENPDAVNQVFNVALDDRTSLNRLFEMVRDVLAETKTELGSLKPGYREFRPGDVRHSQADISKAKRLLNYAPTHRLEEGIRIAMPWYISHFTTPEHFGV
jgi:UDP-N-acetylglucosamine 4-epimerase